MQPEDFWKDFVGQISPREFLGPQPPASVAELHARVDQHVSHLPALYGVTLRKTWKRTWSGFGYNRDQVADGIICYLEAKSADWESTPGIPLTAPRREASSVAAPSTEAPEPAVSPAPESTSESPQEPTVATEPAPSAPEQVPAVAEPAATPESGTELTP